METVRNVAFMTIYSLRPSIIHQASSHLVISSKPRTTTFPCASAEPIKYTSQKRNHVATCNQGTNSFAANDLFHGHRDTKYATQ